MRDKIVGIGKMIVIIIITIIILVLFAIVGGILGMIAVNLLPSIALVLLVCRLVKRYIVRRIYFKLIATGEYAGHGYVDMGLSVKWATCNVGADSPNDYGNYYAWGETETKSSYDEGNCETWKKKIGDIGGTIRDVAHAEWGGGWRMPTVAEFEELRHNCIWTWGTLDGYKGYKVRSEKTGNWIFLPAAGRRRGTSLDGAGKVDSFWNPTSLKSFILHACGPYFRSCDRGGVLSYDGLWIPDALGYYWSSAPLITATIGVRRRAREDPQDAVRLGFDSSDRSTHWDCRHYGLSVRPVGEF